MDSLRGQVAGHDPDGPEGETAPLEGTRAPVRASDERRMQVRAYNFWAGLLGPRTFPDIADLRPDTLADFGPRSVLLDFSDGVDNPAIAYLGAVLEQECAADGPLPTLGAVPGGSLLSRITEHYRQILVNEAPIGFEAEFVNHAGVTILYRGILLPFSKDGARKDATIDYVYGVINWKERAGPLGEDRPRVEADVPRDARPAMLRGPEPLTEWADGPADIGLAAADAFAAVEPGPAASTSERLRAVATRPLTALAVEGEEFTLLIARRLPGGEIALVGEVPGDDTLLERAARHLLG